MLYKSKLNEGWKEVVLTWCHFNIIICCRFTDSSSHIKEFNFLVTKGIHVSAVINKKPWKLHQKSHSHWNLSAKFYYSKLVSSYIRSANFQTELFSKLHISTGIILNKKLNSIRKNLKFTTIPFKIGILTFSSLPHRNSVLWSAKVRKKKI